MDASAPHRFGGAVPQASLDLEKTGVVTASCMMSEELTRRAGIPLSAFERLQRGGTAGGTTSSYVSRDPNPENPL